MLWYSDKVPSDDLSWDRVDVTIKGVTYQDPVYVEMITGKVFELDKSAWKTDGEVYEYDERKVREKLRTLGYLD